MHQNISLYSANHPTTHHNPATHHLILSLARRDESMLVAMAIVVGGQVNYNMFAVSSSVFCVLPFPRLSIFLHLSEYKASIQSTNKQSHTYNSFTCFRCYCDVLLYRRLYCIAYISTSVSNKQLTRYPCFS